MNFDEIATCVAPLIAGAAPQDARWLGRLFRSPATFEAFRSLENELFIERANPASNSLLITSATRAEGRTTTALLLAVLSCAFDRARKVLLVDADTDTGRLTSMLGGGAGSPGLSELFETGANSAECVSQTALPNLGFTPVARVFRSGIRFSPIAFERYIQELQPRYDLIVVDSPSAGANKSILSLASVLGNAVIVVKYGGPTREQVASLREDLVRVRARVLGCILNQREYVVPRLFYGSR